MTPARMQPRIRGSPRRRAMMPPTKAATMMSAMSPAMPMVSLYQTGTALFSSSASGFQLPGLVHGVGASHRLFPEVGGAGYDEGGDGGSHDQAGGYEGDAVDDLRVAGDRRGEAQGDHAEKDGLAHRVQLGVGVWHPDRPVHPYGHHEDAQYHQRVGQEGDGRRDGARHSKTLRPPRPRATARGAR